MMAKTKGKTSTASERKGAEAKGSVVATVEAPKKVQKTPVRFPVTHDTTDAEIVRLESEGAELSFDGIDFRVLDEPTIQVLSHANARAYFMAYGEWKARSGKKEKRSAVEILDPLVGHEEARLHFAPRGDDGREFFKKWHLAWIFCTTASGFKQLGYSEVTEADPVDVGISSNASGYYLTKDTKGQDELLLMKVKAELARQHDEAVVAKSKRQITGARDNFESDLDRVSRGQVKPMKESEEDRTVEKVKVTRDTVNEAFKQK
jgi:hypothetical protein